MKRILFIVSFITVVSLAGYAAQDVMINRGGDIKLGAIYVNTTTATVLLSTANPPIDFELTDGFFYNYGPYDIFLGSTSNVSVSGAGEGCRLVVGKSLPLQGSFNGAPIWAKALTSSCTIYYGKAYRTKR